jgi:hypothetical protein
LFDIFSTLLKYIFITVIYLFIFSIIRMIFLDIRAMNRSKHGRDAEEGLPYIKLINRRDSLDLKVEESYIIEDGLKVGRSRNNGIMIADDYLSSEHAVFTRENDSFLIRDLGSTNGTLVNGIRLKEEPMLLKDGDKIHFGQLDFLFVDNLGVEN